MYEREWTKLGLFVVSAGGLVLTDEPKQRNALKFFKF